MTRKDLFDDGTWRETTARLETLQPDTPARWGRMNAGQALAHCAEVVAVCNGRELHGTPLLVRLLGRFVKGVVAGPKAYPRNARTHPQYVILDEVDFEAARADLVAQIEALRARTEASLPHPVFGRWTREEAGRAMHKHLDHHLAQFGV